MSSTRKPAAHRRRSVREPQVDRPLQPILPVERDARVSVTAAAFENASAAGADASGPSASRRRWRRAPAFAGLMGAGAAVALLVFGLALRDTATPTPEASADAAVAASPADTAPVATVSVVEAREREIAPLAWIPASVHSRADLSLAAEVAGRVREIAAVGDRLQVGDTLARIDTEQAALAAVEQGARLQRLGIEFELAQRQLQRFSQLAESAHVSRLQLDEAESRLQALAAERGEAQAALAQIQLQLDRAHLRSPIAGLVVERFAEPGEWLGAGQTLLRLVDTNALEVRARAPLEWAAGLAPGSVVQLRGQRGDRPVGISALVPVGDEVSRQLELRVSLEGEGLAVGSAVQLGVPTAAARPALSVPRDALLVRREGRFVMRVTEDDRAERVEVEPGESVDAWIAVSGALAAGDRVIVRGAERLIDGQRVQVSDGPMTALVVGGGSPP